MSGSFQLASRPVALFVAVLVSGCIIPKSVGFADDEAEDGNVVSDSSDDGTPPGVTSAAGGTGSTTSGEPDPSSGTTVGGASEDASDGGNTIFIAPDSGILESCDLWQQSCPPGEKCAAWANDGGNAWNATHCVPVVDDPAQVGDPCTVEDPGTSGIDDCALGSMCWNLDADLEGTCVGLCGGSEEDPICVEEGTACALSNDGVLILCLPTCDPVLQGCDEGQACYPFNDLFLCLPDVPVEDGGPGDSCEDIAVCDPGLFCALPELVPGCVSAGCCTPYCNITDPMPACLTGQVCTPYYEAGMAPEGFEDIGICTLPA